LKRFISLLIILFFPAFVNYSVAQTEDLDIICQKFLKLYNSGDILNAEKCLLQIINSGDKIPKGYETFIYNGLGATSTLLGRYKVALDYYNLAEKSIDVKSDSTAALGDNYINKAIIYGYQKSYPVAIDYFEKGIRIYTGHKNPDRWIRQRISAAYLISASFCMKLVSSILH